MSYPNYVDYRDGASSRVRLAAYGSAFFSVTSMQHAGTATEPERVRGEVVSANFFSVLGTRLVAGRGFMPEEDHPGAPPVAVISDRLWQRHFAADPAAIGATVTINGQPFTLIGVAPRHFNGAEVGEQRDVWVPMSAQAIALPTMPHLRDERGAWWLRAVGRIGENENPAGVRAALLTVDRQLAQAYPALHEHMSVAVTPVRGGLNPGERGDAVPLAVLAAAVTALVLLIACSNVANLLLGRAAGRGREIGVRLALGAGRARLIRQLLVESTVLALIGGAAGLLLALWAPEILLSAIGGGVPLDVRPDWRLVLFTAGLCVTVGIVFGLAPALHATRRDALPALRGEGTPFAGVTRSRAGGIGRLQGGFVVAQLSLSLVLLVLAGLLLRSQAKALAVDPGFDASDRVATASFDLSLQGFSEARARTFHEQLAERITALPGIAAVSYADPVPLSGRMMGTDVAPLAAAGEPARDRMSANVIFIWPDFFQAIGTPLLRGRDVLLSDDERASHVVVVNETFAARAWPGEDPIGRRIVFHGEDEPVEVVGVARTGKYDELSEDPRPVLFLPLRQHGVSQGERTLIIRADGGDASTFLPALRRELRALDATLPVYRVRTLGTALDVRLAERRQGSLLVAIFGGLALVLAAIGVYGVTAFTVTQRTREIGVRVALGATGADVRRLFLRRGFRLTLTGLAAGLLLATAAGRLVTGMVYGVGAADITTFTAVAVLLAGATLLASWLPARRAARVDPLVALRTD
jgi:predicted permease